MYRKARRGLITLQILVFVSYISLVETQHRSELYLSDHDSTRVVKLKIIMSGMSCWDYWYRRKIQLSGGKTWRTGWPKMVYRKWCSELNLDVWNNCIHIRRFIVLMTSFIQISDYLSLFSFTPRVRIWNNYQGYYFNSPRTTGKFTSPHPKPRKVELVSSVQVSRQTFFISDPIQRSNFLYSLLQHFKLNYIKFGIWIPVLILVLHKSGIYETKAMPKFRSLKGVFIVKKPKFDSVCQWPWQMIPKDLGQRKNICEFAIHLSNSLLLQYHFDWRPFWNQFFGECKVLKFELLQIIHKWVQKIWKAWRWEL